MGFDVVLVTSQAYIGATPGRDFLVDQVVEEDTLALDALKARGYSCDRVSWDDTAFDWSSTKTAVIRTTWDYFERFSEFSLWMEKAASLTRLINPAKMLRWNMNKMYLKDLSDEGIPIPPTEIIPVRRQCTLGDLMRTRGWSEAVLKPLVSGAARLTFRLTDEGADFVPDGPLPGHPVSPRSVEPTFQECISQEGFMLQQFVEEVVTGGEVSLMVMGGKYTHAVRKRAKEGDFRVQDDWGGSVEVYEAPPSEIAFAEEAVRVAEKVSGCSAAYARVDVVTGKDGPLLIELELVEPELWLRKSRKSVEAYAEAIAAAVKDE